MRFTDDFDFLSNFYRVPFAVPELNCVVQTAEHAFQAFKTLDPNERMHVITAGSPGLSKREGRRVTRRPDWDTGARVHAMQVTLYRKFELSELRAKLLATDNLRLVETNDWHDQYWGDCTCYEHAVTPGTNMLGELLMSLRTRLKEES